MARDADDIGWEAEPERPREGEPDANAGESARPDDDADAGDLLRRDARRFQPRRDHRRQDFAMALADDALLRPQNIVA